MRVVREFRVEAGAGRRRGQALLACVACAGMACALLAVAVQAQSNSLATWSVVIVLPPRVMAGHPATLAVFGADGKLAEGVTVTIDDGQMVTTDRTGRAVFTAPASRDFVLAKASGASVAALIDPATGSSEPAETTVPPVISLKDRFWVCTAGLRGDADADNIWINGEPALVVAASPECLVAIPNSKATPGPSTILVKAPGVEVTAHPTLVALEFDAPQPALVPGKKSKLGVRVRGSDEKLGLVVDNATPGVLRFARGDSQEVATRGGQQNDASIEVRAIRSGDYSFRARLIPAPDGLVALRYLLAAANAAPQEQQAEVRGMAKQLSRHPGDAAQLRTLVGEMVTRTIDGDFRTLLRGAWEAL